MKNRNQKIIRNTIPKIFFLIFLIFVFPGRNLSLDSKKTLTQYRLDSWPMVKGLSQFSVTAILQTHEGFLRIGSQAGLLRFDGLDFTIFDKSNLLESGFSSISDIFEDKTKTLWVGSKTDGLFSIKNGKVTRYTKDNGLTSNTINAICEDADGNIWIGTNAGLNRFRNGKFEKFTVNNGLSYSFILSLYLDSKKRLWIGTNGGGLSCFENENFKNFTTDNGLSDNRVTSITEDKNGSLWIATSNGLNNYSNNKFIVYTIKDGLINNTIRILLNDKENNLWIGTEGGLSRFKQGIFESLTSKEGLTNDNIYSLEEDYERNIWIGTVEGLNCLKDTKFTFYSSRNGLASNNVYSAYEDHKKRIWIGTSEGLNCYADGRFYLYTKNEGLPDNAINYIHEDRNENIWVGTRGGLSLFTNGKFKTYTTRNSPAGNNIKYINSDSKNNIWFGTAGRGISLLKEGKIKTYGIEDGLPSDFIRHVYEDSKNNLWFTTTGGLALYKNGGFHPYTIKNGLSNNVIISIFEDSKKNLWIGTSNGLNLFKDEEFKRFTTKEGLSDNTINFIYEDSRDIIWIATRKGLSRIENGQIYDCSPVIGTRANESFVQIVEDNNQYLWVTSVKGILKISTNELNAAAAGKNNSIHVIFFDNKNYKFRPSTRFYRKKSSDGKLWYPTSDGILMIDPDNINLNTIPPPVVIDEMIYDTTVINPESLSINFSFSFSPGIKKLEFHYSALSFREPEKNRYKIMLMGFDDNWLDVGQRRTAYYTNVPPGTYTFRVIASNNDEIWNYSGASFSFRLESHFYQTIWFYSLCLLLAAGFIYGGYKYRIRKLEFHNSYLRKMNEALSQLSVSANFHRGELNVFVQEVTKTASNTLDISGSGVWMFDDDSLLNCIDYFDKDIGKHKTLSGNEETLIKDHINEQIKHRLNILKQAGGEFQIQEIKLPFVSAYNNFVILFAPVRIHNKIIGTVTLIKPAVTKDWTSEEKTFSISLAEYISLSIETIEKKRVDEKIRINEQWLKIILDTAIEGFLRIDSEENIHEVNPEMCTILGLLKENILGRKIYEFVDEKNALIFREQIKLRKTGIKSSYEITLKRGDESEVICFFNASPLFDINGGFVGSFALVSDINLRKRMEAELKNTRNYLKNIFNAISSMLISINMDGIITEWNTAAEKFTGVSANEAMSENLWSALPFADKFRLQIEKVLKTKEPIELFRISIDYFGKKYFNIGLYPLYFAGMEGVVLRIDDITEYEKKDDQLRQIQKMETIGNLAGGLAHDFNNVLGGIIGTTSLMKYHIERGKLFETNELKSKIAVIEDSSRRAGDMVRRLLTLSRKQELILAPVDLNMAINHVIKICESTFDKSVEIKFIPAPDLTLIKADATQVEQVLLNLCVNAAHAMTIMRGPDEKQGGILTISNNKLLADKYFSSAHPEAIEGTTYWLVRVSDTGVGMSADTIEKIFDPFYTTKEKSRGTGLGLSMAYSIIRQHGGFIDVYSQPALGSTFNVYLPEIDVGSLIETETKSEEAIPMGSGLILVIDDEELMRETAKNILEECGYNVLLAADGEEGQSIFINNSNEVKLIVMDMSMPKMSGKELFLKLKESFPDIKVLLTSGFRQDERVQEIIKSGVSGFIQKPFTLMELAKKVKEIL